MSKRILVADDDPDIVRAISMLLEDEGYEVVSAVDSSTEAVVRKSRPDMILLDIWMSGIDGRDICRRLKADDDTKDIPIILVSANRDTEQIARESGADGFLAKPFDINVLLDAVEEQLAKAGDKPVEKDSAAAAK